MKFEFRSGRKVVKTVSTSDEVNTIMRKLIKVRNDDSMWEIVEKTIGNNVEVVIPASKIKKSIAEILKDEGFIKDWEVSSDEDSFPEIKLQLKYLNDGQPVIRKIKRESKPGLRVYLKSNDAKPILSGQGISIITTSKGVMSDRKCREEKVGGEILCTVW